MSAEIKPRILIEKRTKLDEVIPLSTPFTIFVDPSSACNFQCSFCPNGDKKKVLASGRKINIMKLELFKKIIDDMYHFDKKLKYLRLYKEGEPLLNKWLPDMIRYAKDKDIAEKVDFTTNGSLLSPSKNLDIIGAGVDRIVISIEALSSEKYRHLSKVDLDFKEFVANIKHLYKHKGNCKICIKSTDAGILPEEEGAFYNIFGEMADEIFIEKITPIWPDFEMNAEKTDYSHGLYGQSINPVEVCPYIFYSMTVNSDGSVSACFVDWEHHLIMGNVNEESLYGIWNNENFTNLRKTHLAMQRNSNLTCSKCGQLIYATADNIDIYAAEILKKF